MRPLRPEELFKERLRLRRLSTDCFGSGGGGGGIAGVEGTLRGPLGIVGVGAAL